MLLRPAMLLLAAMATAAAETKACTEPAECAEFAGRLPANTQHGFLTCESQYSQVDKTAPPGLQIKMVCPVSCDACPEDASGKTDAERCLASPHCFPRFDVCLDGYGGYPDCRHMPLATSYDGKQNHHGQPHGFGKLQCARNAQGYHTDWEVDPAAGDFECSFAGEFDAGERHGDGVFTHVMGTGEGGARFAYEYDGEWAKDVRAGVGTMTASFTIPQLKSEKPLRWLYEGEWEAGLPHGVGRLESTDSTVYNGPLRRGAPSGFGTLCAGKGVRIQAR